MHWIIKLILSGVALNALLIMLCIVILVKARHEVKAVFRALIEGWQT